jgi:hypothetical protein
MSGFVLQKKAETETLNRRVASDEQTTVAGHLLPKELTTSVLAFLDVSSVNSASLTCKEWNMLSQSNIVWRKHLGVFLETLAHVPTWCASTPLPCVQVLKTVKDDIKRKDITAEELTQFTWSFRFKQAAGFTWVDMDPYWHGKECMKVRFYRDGTTTRTLEGEPHWENIDVLWRWASSDTAEPGSGVHPCRAVKYSVNGTDVPQLHVTRHPRHGGFVMQSVWVVYSSFPMPAPGEDEFMDNIDSEIADSQSQEVQEYNASLGADNPENAQMEVVAENEDEIVIIIGPYQIRAPRNVAEHWATLPPEEVLRFIQTSMRQQDNGASMEESLTTAQDPGNDLDGTD